MAMNAGTVKERTVGAVLTEPAHHRQAAYGLHGPSSWRGVSPQSIRTFGRRRERDGAQASLEAEQIFEVALGELLCAADVFAEDRGWDVRLAIGLLALSMRWRDALARGSPQGVFARLVLRLEELLGRLPHERVDVLRLAARDDPAIVLDVAIDPHRARVQ